MRKERKRLDFADRKRIEAMKNSGVKVTEIAQAVGVHRATIYHELKRGGMGIGTVDERRKGGVPL